MLVRNYFKKKNDFQKKTGENRHSAEHAMTHFRTISTLSPDLNSLHQHALFDHVTYMNFLFIQLVSTWTAFSRVRHDFQNSGRCYVSVWR